MGAIDELRAYLQEVFNTRAKAREFDRGLLGDGNNNLYVAGDAERRVWFRKNGQTSQLLKVYCYLIRPMYDLPIVCGTRQEEPGLYQALAWDRTAYELGWEGLTSVPFHAEMHEWYNTDGNDDTVYVWTRALMPFRVSPQDVPDLTVKIEGPEVYLWGVTWNVWSTVAALNLAGSVPGIANRHRFTLVYIDGATNTVGTRDGALFNTAIPILPANWPAPLSGEIPLALVYLTDTITEITETEIVDARVLVSTGGGGLTPAAHHLVDTTVHDDTEAYVAPTQGDVLRFDTDWERLAIGTAHQIYKVNAGGTLPIWAGWDWDEIAAAVGADMVHDHSAAVEGGQNLHQILELEFQDAALLTINAGTVTRTQVYHIIAAEAGVADNLDNILGGVEGDELIIRPDAGDTITCRHNQGGAGDFWFAGGADIALDNEDHLCCIRDVNDRWCDQSGGAGGGAAHNLLSATHPDTVAAAPIRGDIPVASVAPAWTKLPIGLANRILQSDGNDPSWAATTDGQTASTVVRTDANAGLRPKRFAVGNGVAVPVGDGLARIERNEATVNTVLELLRLARLTTVPGGASAGMGGRLLWTLEDDANNEDEAVALDSYWFDATSGSEDAFLNIWRRRASVFEWQGYVPAWLDSINVSVGAGGDFATIQAAINYCKAKIITGSGKISVAAGTYDEAVVANDLFVASLGSLTLEGDTRVLAGLTYVDNTPGNRKALANGGSGTISLSNAGNNVIVVGSVSNPDFDADGWVNGDKVLIHTNAGAVTEYTATAFVNNVITLSVAAPAIGNTGTSVTLLPNRRITRTGGNTGTCLTIDGARVAATGFYTEATAAASNGVLVTNAAVARLANLCANASSVGIRVEYDGTSCFANGGAVSAVGAGIFGAYCSRMAYLCMDYAVSVKYSYGFPAQGARMDAEFSIVSSSGVYGFWGLYMGVIVCTTAAAVANGTAYRADYNAYMDASSTNAYNVGNVTNYSPAVSDTEGNVYAIITWS